MSTRSGGSSQLHVAASPGQRHTYERVVSAVLDQGISEFIALTSGVDSGDPHGDRQRRVDTRKWKAFKKHETVQIYRSRERARDRPEASATANASARKSSSFANPPLIDWVPMARLLCVGTLLGSLEDAMYGAVTPTELAMATRSLYIKDEFTQHRVLLDIHGPSRDDPFRYLGIKWGARNSSIAALIKARETLYLEASGCRDVQLTPETRGRIGFVIYHSIDLAEVPKIEANVRARISACYLFHEAAPGVVTLYGTLTSDAGGHLPTKLAALAGASVMVAVSRVTECALKKKLAMMLSRRVRGFTDAREHDVVEQNESSSRCVQCSRNLSGFSTLTGCLICQTRVCSRCITSRRLLLGRTKATLRRKTVAMCKGCMSTARRPDKSSEAAAWEFVHSRGSVRLLSATPSFDADESDLSNRDDSDHHLSARSNGTTQSMHGDSEVSVPVAASSTGPPTLKIIEIASDDEHFVDDIAVPVDDRSQTLPAQWATQQMPQPTKKIEWWMRINELRLQAEETYQLAREQTITMEQAAAAAARVATK